MNAITPDRIGLILINVVLGSLGQTCLKHGMSTAPKLPAGLFDKVQALVTIIFTRPFVFSGFALYGVSALLWLTIIRTVPLSFAYPTIALSYVIVTFISWAVFHETVNWMSLTGLFIICCGVATLGIGLARASGR
ncbi:MAG: EamA family transporter [Armatimonadota bacterium]|nr:EamA family transporter [Armatimonadota bacterium]